MPDLRGFGQSSKDVTPLHGATLLSDSGSIGSLRDRALSLLGYSLGGAVSFAFSVEEPERIERLVLVNTLPSFRPTTLRKNGRSS